MKNRFIFGLLLIFTLALYSCNNLFSDIKEDNSNSSTSSNVSSSKCLVSVSIKNDTLTKAAFPTVSDWQVTATSTAGTVDFTESSGTFSGTLFTGLPWTVTVLGYSDSTKTTCVGSGTKVFTPTSSSETISITPTHLSSGTGSIELSVSVANLTDFNLTNSVAYLDGDTTKTTNDKSQTGTSFKFKFLGITAGKHSITVIAKNSTGAILSDYTDTAVYVWPYLTTSSWYYGGSAVTTITLLKVENFYVAGSGADLLPSGSDTTGNGTLGSPYSTITKTLERCTDTSGTVEYKIYTNGSITDNITISGKKVSIIGLGTTQSTITGVASASKSVIETDSNLSLTNLCITGGSGTNGAGINQTGTSTALTISNCKITGNTATTNGGGIYSAGTLALSGSVIVTENKAKDGCGIYYVGASDLTLDTGIEISGNSNHTTGARGGGIFFSSTGKILYVKNDAKIFGNQLKSGVTSGGGVYVDNGTLELSGTIGGDPSKENTAQYGGGVLIAESGLFTMNGGTISYNTSSNTGGGLAYKSTTALSLTSGNITNNISTGLNGGGGLYIYGSSSGLLNGIFIDSNTADNGPGGGVLVSGTASLKMASGTISNNTAKTFGAGVSITASASFEMNGGYINSNNISSTTGFGGGVYIKGTFTMTGGSISDNTINGTANYDSCGVYVLSGSTFEMGGSAVINSNNCVYLSDKTNYIAIISELTGTAPVATITPVAYEDETVILYPDGGTDSNNYVSNAVSTSKFSIEDVSDCHCRVVYNSSSGCGVLKGSKDYYVSSSGSDDNDGSYSSPFASISKAVDSMSLSEASIFVMTDLTMLAIPGEIEIPSSKTVTLKKYLSDVTITAASGKSHFKTNDSTLILTDGITLTGGTADRGGSIYISSGTFEMSGGKISGNTATGDGGGAIYNENGQIKITGGVLSYNSAENGGAIFDATSGLVNTIEGAEFSNNSATNNGGAILTSSDQFSIKNTTLKNNTATGGTIYSAGGAIYIGTNGKLTLSNVVITGNKAPKGGGIYVYSSSSILNIQGVTQVYNNTLLDGTTTNNIYLPTGKLITITGALTDGSDNANIGVSMETPGTFTSGYQTYNSETPSTYFTSDDSSYSVALSGTEATLTTP